MSSSQTDGRTDARRTDGRTEDGRTDGRTDGRRRDGRTDGRTAVFNAPNACEVLKRVCTSLVT